MTSFNTNIGMLSDCPPPLPASVAAPKDTVFGSTTPSTDWKNLAVAEPDSLSPWHSALALQASQRGREPQGLLSPILEALDAEGKALTVSRSAAEGALLQQLSCCMVNCNQRPLLVQD